MGEGKDESEIPPFRGGSLIWHWGATRDGLGMPGLSDWSHGSGQEPAPPPPPQTPHHLPSYTHGAEPWVGWRANTGSPDHVGRSQPRDQQLDPEMMATTILPAGPGSWAKVDLPCRQNQVLAPTRAS